ncbi:hypothetical protein PENANT_c014G10407 [Penicillium antarcticum]|uniref:REJ domain-containing protein n=2 Tax=Penicillium antarcticum TaxID=416450 RepID=A0A1V6Q4B8_9EURO|nr:hypothetical protein PENANT_c014G10407 [Penicillium antarcticum]
MFCAQLILLLALLAWTVSAGPISLWLLTGESVPVLTDSEPLPTSSSEDLFRRDENETHIGLTVIPVPSPTHAVGSSTNAPAFETTPLASVLPDSVTSLPTTVSTSVLSDTSEPTSYSWQNPFTIDVSNYTEDPASVSTSSSTSKKPTTTHLPTTTHAPTTTSHPSTPSTSSLARTSISSVDPDGVDVITYVHMTTSPSTTTTSAPPRTSTPRSSTTTSLSTSKSSTSKVPMVTQTGHVIVWLSGTGLGPSSTVTMAPVGSKTTSFKHTTTSSHTTTTPTKPIATSIKPTTTSIPPAIPPTTTSVPPAVISIQPADASVPPSTTTVPPAVISIQPAGASVPPTMTSLSSILEVSSLGSINQAATPTTSATPLATEPVTVIATKTETVHITVWPATSSSAASSVTISSSEQSTVHILATATETLVVTIYPATSSLSSTSSTSSTLSTSGENSAIPPAAAESTADTAGTPAALATTQSTAPVPTSTTTSDSGQGLLSVIPVTPAGFIHVTETVTEVVTDKVTETVTATVTATVTRDV